jgi:hypothetical protein
MVEAPITVNVAYDPEIDVWYVKASSLAGLNVEAKTVDKLIDKLPGAVTDLLEESGRPECLSGKYLNLLNHL